MFLGLDIGGTKVAGVLLSEDGGLLDSRWTHHDARTADEVCRLLADVARQLTDGIPTAKITIGASIAGLVGSDGRVTRRGVMDLDRADMASRLEALTGARPLVVNDADATLRAAVAHDPDGLVQDAVLLALGTGVAGAVMWRGQLLQGRLGLAGELGHLPVLLPLAYPCVCGGSGCLEQYASGRGLAERAVDAARRGAADDLLLAAGVPADGLNAIQVVDAAREGVMSALTLLDDAADAVVQALVAVSVMTEPRKVYLGGSVGHAAFDLLLHRIEERLTARWPFAETLPPPPVTRDRVGPHAAAVGAALLARDRLRREISAAAASTSTAAASTTDDGKGPSHEEIP